MSFNRSKRQSGQTLIIALGGIALIGVVSLTIASKSADTAKVVIGTVRSSEARTGALTYAKIRGRQITDELNALHLTSIAYFKSKSREIYDAFDCSESGTTSTHDGFNVTCELVKPPVPEDTHGRMYVYLKVNRVGGSEGDRAELLVRNRSWPMGAMPHTPAIEYARMDVSSVDGSVYLGGTVLGDLRAGEGKGGEDALVRKLRPDRTIAWQRQFGSTLNDSFSTAVRTYVDRDDGQEYVIVVGITNGVSVAGAGPPEKNDEDCFVAKLTSTGAVLWVRQFGSSDSQQDSPKHAEVDDLGNVYIIGLTRGIWTPGFTKVGQLSTFFVRLDRDGNRTGRFQYDFANDDGVYQREWAWGVQLGSLNPDGSANAVYLSLQWGFPDSVPFGSGTDIGLVKLSPNFSDTDPAGMRPFLWSRRWASGPNPNWWDATYGLHVFRSGHPDSDLIVIPGETYGRPCAHGASRVGVQPSAGAPGYAVGSSMPDPNNPGENVLYGENFATCGVRPGWDGNHWDGNDAQLLIYRSDGSIADADTRGSPYHEGYYAATVMPGTSATTRRLIVTGWGSGSFDGGTHIAPGPAGVKDTFVTIYDLDITPWTNLLSSPAPWAQPRLPEPTIIPTSNGGKVTHVPFTTRFLGERDQIVLAAEPDLTGQHVYILNPKTLTKLRATDLSTVWAINP